MGVLRAQGIFRIRAENAENFQPHTSTPTAYTGKFSSAVASFLINTQQSVLNAESALAALGVHRPPQGTNASLIIPRVSQVLWCFRNFHLYASSGYSCEKNKYIMHIEALVEKSSRGRFKVSSFGREVCAAAFSRWKKWFW